MKKYNSILAIAFFFVLLGACGTRKQQDLTESTVAEEKKPVSSISVYNKTGKLQKTDYYNHDGTLKYTLAYNYNDSGDPLSIKRTDSGSEFSMDLETYFYKGSLCTRHFIYDSSGTLNEEYYWTYTAENALKSEKHVTRFRSGAGIVETTEIKTYDESENVVSSEINTGGYESRTEYEYYASGLCGKETLYESSDGAALQPSKITLHYYDESNREIKKIRRDADWYVESTEIWNYDDSGNVVMYSLYYSELTDDAHLVSRTESSYTSDGKKEYEHKVNGTRGETADRYYEYDEAGNNIRLTLNEYYGENDSKVTVTENEFDSHGTVIKSTVTNPEEIKSVEYECSCVYYDSGGLKEKTEYYTA